MFFTALQKLFSRFSSSRSEGRRPSESEASEAASTSSSSSSGTSDSGSSVLSWASASAAGRKRHLDDMLDSMPAFFGSLLDDADLQTQLLAEIGDAFLVSCPLNKAHCEERCTAYRRWHLVILESNEVIYKLKVIYKRRILRVAVDKNTALFDFIARENLKMIERPWTIQPEQLTEKMRIVPQQAFPIHGQSFRLGSLSQMTLNFDAQRRIPVFCLSIRSCTQEEIVFLLREAERRKRFGSVRIWRLWGVCEYSNGSVSLVLEDIAYGSVAEYVRVGLRPYTQLRQFAIQTAEGLRYLEKFSFVHRRLSLDVCLLTYNYNVKIAIYGLSPGELYPTTDDLQDVDHCRWIPAECLPHPDGPKAPYNSAAMVYSFGTIIWSLFHGAALPYRNEPDENIKDRSFRSVQTLRIEDQLVPADIKEVILQCWKEDASVRGRFRDLKELLKKVRGNVDT